MKKLQPVTSETQPAPMHKGEGVQLLWRGTRLLLLVTVLIGLVFGYQYYTSGLAESYRENTTKARQANDWEQVLYWGPKWLNNEPENPEPYLLLADAYQATEQWQELADLIVEFPASDRRNLKLQELRAELLLGQLNQIGAAQQAWENILTIVPNHATACQRLTYIYSMTMQRRKLAKLLRDSIQNGCEPQEAFFYLAILPNLSFSDGLTKTEAWLQNEPENETLKIANAIYTARTKPDDDAQLFVDDQIDEDSPLGTTKLIEKMLKRFPQNIELRSFLLTEAALQGDIDSINKQLKPLRDIADTDSRVWRYIAFSEKFSRQYDEALKASQKAVDIDPLDWKSRLELSDAQRLTGNREQAKRNSVIANKGKKLERLFLELPNSRFIKPELNRQLYDYMIECGEKTLADSMLQRVQLY